MSENEMIFCLKRADLECLFPDQLPQGACKKPDLELVFSLPQYFLRRGEAEQDSIYKQIIPYQLFSWQDRFFVYQRGGGVGEGRLAGRLSIGIGGHINIEDADDNRLTPVTYQSALLRERQEELCCKGDDLPSTFVGWINDDSDPVGQVHLGVVHCCEVEDKNTLSIRKDGEDIHAIGWWSREDIKAKKEQFEKWSLLALSLVSPTSFPALTL